MRAFLSHSLAKTHFQPTECIAVWNPPIPANKSMNLNFGLLSFFLATAYSISKVNEFTLAGAVLADSLDRGARQKRKGEEPTHSSPKSVTFSKECNSSHYSCNGLLHPFRVRNDTRKIKRSCAYAITLQNNPKRIQNAQGTLRPYKPRATASYCLIPCV